MKILLFCCFCISFICTRTSSCFAYVTGTCYSRIYKVWGIWAKISHSGDHLHVLVKSMSVALESYGFIHDM